MEGRQIRKTLAAAGIAAGVAGVSVRWFGPWERGWGTTEEERGQALPGDEFVENPEYLTTRAITMDAEPGDLFPWLVQMGYQRGGLYSYDLLDRIFGILDGPSAKEIVPEWQNLSVGDEIPLGKGPAFPVAAIERDRWLVLAGGENGVSWSWSMVLRATPDGRLRFITRNRGAGMGSPFGQAMLDVAAFIMVRRWLIVLKGRAEGTARERRAREAAIVPA